MALAAVILFLLVLVEPFTSQKEEGPQSAWVKLAAPEVPKVVCYFSSWAYERPEKWAFTVDHIDPYSCTHFIYAFAGLDPETYTIKSLNEEYELRQGNYKTFVGLKIKNPNAKVLIAIGGWAEGGKKYSHMTRTAKRRALFIASVLDFLQQNGFDGLDLDWEYPAAFDRDGVPEDRQNFVDLIKEMRSAFTDREYLLTAAITPAKIRVDFGYDVRELSRYLDFINVMTYDLHGNWEGFADHHSRLRERVHDEGGYEYMNADFGIKYLIRKGADRRKLIMGIPFYARSFTLLGPNDKDADESSIKAGTPGNYTLEAGFLAYYEVCPYFTDDAWLKQRDDGAGVPFMTSGNQWIGYDDEKSVGEKANYIRQESLGGAMVWAIDLDDYKGDCGKPWPLINKINNVLWRGQQNSPEIDPPVNGHAGMPFPPYHPLLFRPPSNPQKVRYPVMSHPPQMSHHPLHQHIQYYPKTRPSGRPITAQAVEADQSGVVDHAAVVNLNEGKYMHGLVQPKIQMQGLTPVSVCAEDYLFADAEDCNHFYQCAGGYLRRVLCPLGMIFVESSQACEVNQARAVCPPTAYQFNCPGDGMFRNPMDCRYFYWCHGDSVEHIKCASNTFFHQEHKVCAHMHDVKDCHGTPPVSTESPEETPTEVPTEGAPEVDEVTTLPPATSSRKTTTKRPITTTRRTTSAVRTTTRPPIPFPTVQTTPAVPKTTKCEWCPTTKRPTNRPGTIPPGLKDDYKVVCYFTNWSWYRREDGKFLPEDTDVSLCTHIVYAFTVLDGNNFVIKAHDPWADSDNDFFRRLVRLKELRPNVKVLVGLGGWNDSKNSKYSQLVHDPAKRQKFITHALQFIREYGFDGLDLDWEYPKCWQVECDEKKGGGPASDKPMFTAWVRELRQAFDQAQPGLLLTAAVSPSKTVIDLAYDVAEIAKDLDYISVMTYDFHGSWEKFTGHNAPLYYYPGDEFDFYNSNSSIHHWIDQGAPPEKLIFGMPAYGQTWTLADTQQTGLKSPATSAGQAGPYTRQAGMMAYYEICHKIRTGSWTVVKDPLGRIGPYAFKGNQWTSFDDVDTIKRKSEYVKSMGLGGAMVWSLDLDDFRNRCCSEDYPILKTINRVLRNYPAKSKSGSQSCTPKSDPPPYSSTYDATGNAHTQGQVVLYREDVCITPRCP